MDIVERLAQQAAEAINGGEFNDGKWFTEGQRQAWRKAMTPAADEIERLRGIINDDRLEGAADEIERLRVDLEVAEDRKAKAQLFHNDMLKEIERLQQLVNELNSVAYVIDSQGVAHHSFTIVYKELE